VYFEKKAFAEVMESSLHTVIAQSWEWDSFPVFGSLVIIRDDSRTIFVLVSDIKTGSSDAARYPYPFRKTHEELLRDHPQIFEFLKTTFTGLVLGYQELEKGSLEKSFGGVFGQIMHLLPSEPAKIHAFIEPCPEQLAKQFFDQDYYLPALFSIGSQGFNFNELLLAVIRYQILTTGMSLERLQGLLQKLSLLMGQDYRQFKLLLQRIEPLVKSLEKG
jgi:hypothetical protein